MEKHCEFLARQTGAEHFRIMPAKRLFALGVGHIRRRGMEPGAKADVPAEVTDVAVVQLNELEWRVLTALKREFEAEEIAAGSLARARGRGRTFRWTIFYETAADFEPAQDHRPFFDFSGARQAAQGRRPRDAFQRAVSLGGAAGPRDRNGPGSGPALHHDARLLARRRAGISQRQRHGRGARHGEAAVAGAQSGHRRGIWPNAASPSVTRTSSGAAAAKSSPRKSPPRPTANGAGKWDGPRSRILAVFPIFGKRVAHCARPAHARSASTTSRIAKHLLESRC